METFGQTMEAERGLSESEQELLELEKILNPESGQELLESEKILNMILNEIAGTNVVVYEKLNASNDRAAKAEFLANPNLVHPNNEYGNLDGEEIRENLEKLKLIKQYLESLRVSDEAKYLLSLANMMLEDSRRKNKFLAANLAYNEAKTPESRAEMARWHKEANANLYGEPEESVFYALLGESIAKIDLDSLSDEERGVYDRLISRIGVLGEVESKRFKPKPETLERFSELVKDFFGNFLKHIPEGKESFSSKEAAEIVNEIIDEELGSDETGWKAEVDDRVSNASASRGVIKFPLDATYSRERLAALIVHELGTHAMRAIPYQSQEIEAFTTGLPGNEAFDEGVAGCVEQALKGKYRDFGVNLYVGIGLATFMNMNFREVYDFLMNLRRLSGEKTDKVLNIVQRIFRGTGELPNNKDLAYYKGVNDVWKYIEEHIDDPNLFDYLFLSGKTNILDSRQRETIEGVRYKMEEPKDPEKFNFWD